MIYIKILNIDVFMIYLNILEINIQVVCPVIHYYNIYKYPECEYVYSINKYPEYEYPGRMSCCFINNQGIRRTSVNCVSCAQLCVVCPGYGVASISRLLEITGLFCKRAL